MVCDPPGAARNCPRCRLLALPFVPPNPVLYSHYVLLLLTAQGLWPKSPKTRVLTKSFLPCATNGPTAEISVRGSFPLRFSLSIAAAAVAVIPRGRSGEPQDCIGSIERLGLSLSAAEAQTLHAQRCSPQ